MSNNRTLVEINVKDSIQVKSDTVLLKIAVGSKEKTYDSYERASKIGTEMVNNILNTIKSYGFNIKKEIKIAGKNISPKYEYSKTTKENENGKATETKYNNILLGYVFYQNIILKTSSSNANIAKLYCDISSNKNIESVNVSYTTEKLEKYKDKLTKKLVKKAKRKAEIIAEAAGLKVIQIKEIKQGNSYNSSIYMNSCCLDECEYDSECELSNDNYENYVQTVLDVKENENKELEDTLYASFYIG